MIHLTTDTPILLATQPADFRQGIDDLAQLCRGRLASEPRSGTLFVFINRSKTMIRTLVYDGSGFWLMTKRLSKGKFQGWPKNNALFNPIAAKYLRQLLLGDKSALSWEKLAATDKE
jgi:transposase